MEVIRPQFLVSDSAYEAWTADILFDFISTPGTKDLGYVMDFQNDASVYAMFKTAWSCHSCVLLLGRNITFPWN